MTITFNRRSTRATKARLGFLLKPVYIKFLQFITGLAFAGSIYLIYSSINSGWLLLGIAIYILIFVLWALGDVKVLRPTQAINSDNLKLEAVLDSKLLAGISKWPLSPQETLGNALITWEGRFVANRLSLPADLLKVYLEKNPIAEIWENAISLARNARLNQVDGGVVVAAIMTSRELADILKEMKLGTEDVISVLMWQQRVKEEVERTKPRSSYGGIGRDWASGYTPTLSRFAKNISREVEYGYYRHIPQVHEAVVDRMAAQLASPNPRVALVGEVGSGKTALVYSMAERLITGNQAHGLEYYYVMELNAAAILSQGRIEETVLRLLAEAIHARNVIVFLDDAHLFFGSGTGAVDLSQVLLPILQQSPLKLVLAMSPRDWQELTGRNPGLTTSIQKLALNAPAPEETIKIVEDAALGIEAGSKTVISYQAIKEVYRLAERYLVESSFPGKGITLLEAAANYSESGLVTPKSVQLAIEATVGTKVSAADQGEKVKLLNLEEEIHRRMVNQTYAVKVVSDALRRARAGVSNPSRPSGSFLFLGPTGVGKTELARALADIYFGGQDKIIRIDMSEYQQPSDIDRLLSPSTGRTGSTLISSIRKQPFSVVLFDEIEKGHPDILNLFLQLLDEGRLTDTGGREASFRDSIIIATSNAAADKIREKIAAGQELAQFEEEIEEQLISSHQFKPELVNRFDDVVLFRPLSKPELRQVVGLMIAGVNRTLESQKIHVALDDEAIGKLVEKGYDPTFGARPMRRMVQRTVENLVAKKILAGEIKSGEELTLAASDIDYEK